MMSDSLFSLDILVAHRGLQFRYPENTILALKKAIDYGASFIELDIQFSSDCLPIIYHDPDLKRVSSEEGNVLDYPRHNLLKLPAYEPQRFGNSFKSEKIAPLEALVSLLKDNPQVTAFVELKDESIEHCGRDTMFKSVQNILDSVKDQVVIISYDYQLVLTARENHWPNVGVVLKQWQDLTSDRVKTIASDFIFIDHEMIPEDISDLKSIEATVVAFEVSDKKLGQRLLKQGVSMLETYKLEQLS
jgi:glycerophosphoryl diester phosphodiesterase